MDILDNLLQFIPVDDSLQERSFMRPVGHLQINMTFIYLRGPDYPTDSKLIELSFPLTNKIIPIISHQNRVNQNTTRRQFH